MGVIQYPIPIPMTVGSNPNLRFMVTTDNETALTTAGYLNSTIAECATPLSNSDIVFALNSFNTTTRTGTFGIYTVVINSATGAIKLNAYSVPGGNVRLPVVVNDFAVFTNTDGQIGDNGYLPSNAALTKVVMASGTITSGDIPAYHDANGTIADNGYKPSDASKTYMAMVAAPVTIGQAAVFADVNGTLMGGGEPGSDLMYTNVNNMMTSAGAVTLFKGSGTATNGSPGVGAVTVNAPAGIVTIPTFTNANYVLSFSNSFLTSTSYVGVTFLNTGTITGLLPPIVQLGSGVCAITFTNVAGSMDGTIVFSYLVM